MLISNWKMNAVGSGWNVYILVIDFGFEFFASSAFAFVIFGLFASLDQTKFDVRVGGVRWSNLQYSLCPKKS